MIEGIGATIHQEMLRKRREEWRERKAKAEAAEREALERVARAALSLTAPMGKAGRLMSDDESRLHAAVLQLPADLRARLERDTQGPTPNG